MAVLFSNLISITNNTKPRFPFSSKPIICGAKRNLILQTPLVCIGIGLTPQVSVAQSSPQESSPSKSLLSSFENTTSWFQFYGDGFAIRVPPEFKDIMEPEDFDAGQSLYGDKAKTDFFSTAQNITDLGSLKEAAKIFVPAVLYLSPA
ncbi:hypothetical protein JHK84_057125 [Glycine max]|nr:hypothetical protein JHK84_057125 [Glycine max]